MKKNFMWTMAALFVSGLAFTACSVEDNPNPNPAQGNIEDLWDKTTTSFDFENGETAPFAATSRMSLAVQDNEAKGSKVLAFINAGNAQNGYGFAYYDFSSLVVKATKVTVKFDYWNTNGGRGQMTIGDALVRGTNGAGAGFGRNSYGAKGAIFRIGSDKSNFFINGDNMADGLATFANKWLTVEVGIYNFDRKVEWVVKDGEEILAQSGTTEGEGEEAVFTPGKVDFWQADANEATQIDCFGFINNNTSYIDNLSIESAIDPSVKFADAKVVFVDPEGNELKEARTVNGRVGSLVSLIESDKAAIYNAENTVKWVYDTDNAAETPIAEEGTVITVKFKDSGKYKWRLRQYFNDGQGANGTRIGTEWIEGEQFVGDSYQVFYQCAYKHPTDGKWYVAPIVNNSYQNRSYKFTGNESTNAAGDIHLMDVKYEKVDSIVWMGEFEDKTAMTLVGEVETWIGWTDPALWEPGNTNANLHFERYSNGQAARLKDGSYFIINDAFEAGEYKIFIFGRSGGSEAMAPTLYYIPAEGGEPVKIEKDVPTIPTTTGGVTVENVKLPAGAKLVIKNDGTTGVDLDLISICKQPAAE